MEPLARWRFDMNFSSFISSWKWPLLLYILSKPKHAASGSKYGTGWSISVPSVVLVNTLSFVHIYACPLEITPSNPYSNGKVKQAAFAMRCQLLLGWHIVYFVDDLCCHYQNLASYLVIHDWGRFPRNFNTGSTIKMGSQLAAPWDSP